MVIPTPAGDRRQRAQAQAGLRPHLWLRIVQAVGGWLVRLPGADRRFRSHGLGCRGPALALVAYRVAAKAANARFTYGFHRVRILAALTNGVALLLLVLWIGLGSHHAAARAHRGAVRPMLAVAVIGLVVNIVGFVVLNGGTRRQQPARRPAPCGRRPAGFGGRHRRRPRHPLDRLDLAGSGAVDPGRPADRQIGLDPGARCRRGALAGGAAGIRHGRCHGGSPRPAEVAEVGHLHVWTLTDETRIATLHITPAPGSDPCACRPWWASCCAAAMACST